MKISENWLQEWINPTLSRAAICERMTMAGLEVESITPVAEPFANVVIGKIITLKKHPEADRLTVCEVDIGAAKLLTIVCGAKNVAVGLKVPAALESALLPNNLNITVSQIRGVTSQGMLCSARELGLAEESEGLLVLPADAPLGVEVWDYLKLADHIIDVSITPNRGDCLSVMGLAKEISALTKTPLTSPMLSITKPSIADNLTVSISAPEACSHYVGRMIRHIRTDALTPIWLQERLRRSGVRSISPVVDVGNYVMLELGQPMHAFDANKISGNVQVRWAKPTEQLALLDGQTVELTADTLVIADDKQTLAIAGVMGGIDSAVTFETQDVFLESAYFTPLTVARSSRHYNLNSESSYRFERGIDPALQAIAIERATQLLLDIVGGQPGPLVEITAEAYLPISATILLRSARIEKILGMQISPSDITEILTRLHFECVAVEQGWQVKVPSARTDILLEVDLIEEIMRLYGSDRVPLRETFSALKMVPNIKNQLPLHTFRNNLAALGYQEVVTYSFVDSQLQHLLNPEYVPKALVNPMTADMAVMRTNLWPGLIKTLIYNVNRQQHSVRLFETGLRFVPHAGVYAQERVLSGLLSGMAFPEQWGIANRAVDFFDLKGHLQALLQPTYQALEFTFQPATHPALHPGQTAEIYHQGRLVGVMGALHPAVMQSLDLSSKIYIFEIQLAELEITRLPQYKEVSKFPEIRRDIAIIVEQTVPAQKIQAAIVAVAGELLKNISLFDVYQGQNVGENRKSLALSLTLQHSSRTLIDEEVAQVIDRVIVALKEKFAAELRG